MAEFAYNSARLEATQVSPFFANLGYESKVYKQLRKNAENSQKVWIQADKLTGLYCNWLKT